MSLAKSFLMGLAKGGLKENNRRASMMEQRMQELATNNATIARERAQSKYESDYKSAMTEHSKINSLRSEEFIDSEGTYTRQYRDSQGYLEFQKPEVRKAYGDDYVKFRDAFDKLGPRGISSSYKTPDEITRDVSKTYESIAARQRVESSQPVLTNMDKLLMGSKENRAAPIEVPEIDQSSAMESQAPQAPQAPQDTMEPKGEYNSPQFPGPTPESPSRSQLRSINLYTANGIDSKTYMQDKTTGEILDENTGEYMRIPEGMNTIASNRNPFTDTYTDKSTGEELKRHLIETYPGDPLADVRMAGKTYVSTGNPVRLGEVSLQPTRKGEFKQQTNNAVTYATVNRVSSLSVDMLGQDYVSNPKTWVASRLATIADALGATLNLTGKTEEDIKAIVSYVDGRLEDDWQAMKDLGPLDAAAIAEGSTEALQTLLAYATTNMLTKDGRITVLAREDAKKITESFISGGTIHTAKLVTLIDKNADNMAEIIHSDINVAMSNMRSPTWERYPDVKRMVTAGWKPLTDNFAGDQIKMNMEKLMTSNPEAYRKSLSSLNQTPFDFESLDEKTIYYNRKYKKNVMLYSVLNPDGSYSFSSNRVQ
jgi:hypothetical protein